MMPSEPCPGLEALGAYLEGREPREAVELHLSVCAGCRARVKDYARLLKDVEESTEAAPPGLSAKILRTAGTRTRRHAAPPRRSALAVALIAAGVLVAAGLVWIWRATPPADSPVVAAPAPRPMPEEPSDPPIKIVPVPPARLPVRPPSPPPAVAPETKVPEPVIPVPPPPPPPPPKPPPGPPPEPAPLPPAPPPEPPKPAVPTRTAVARVHSFHGKVVLLSGNRTALCAPDAELLPEAGIRTFDGSAAVVAFPDGTRLELEASTTLRRVQDLAGQDGTGLRVELEAGAISARIVKQPAGRAMVFATPQGEAQVLGTAFRLAVVGAKGDATRLEVSEGKVRLKRLDGKSVDVPAGQFALAEAGTDLVARKATSLVLHWKLDDAQGGLARDASGNGNDGVIAGEPGWAAGHMGGAVDLLKARVDSPLLDLGKDVRSFTAAYWVSQEVLPGYQDNYFQLIPGFAMVREANMNTGRIRVAFKTDESGDLLGFDSVILKARQWTHVALTWDGAVAILYRNGRDVAKARMTGRILAPQGILARLGGSEKLDAKIDDVRLYRRALSEAEVREVLAGGAVR